MEERSQGPGPLTSIPDAGSVRAVEVPRCELCGQTGGVLHDGLSDRIFGAPGTWRLLECPGCGLVWLDPRPLPDDTSKLYEGEYFTHGSVEDAPEDGFRARIRQAILAASLGYLDEDAAIWSGLVGRLLSLGGPWRESAGAAVMWLPASLRGRLLDVGCGDGSFLTRMRRLGWHVSGLEPDPLAAEVARRRSGAEVVPGKLGEVSFAGAPFDVVTLSHVIEHVDDATGTMKECAALLRPGGRLVMVTPNTSSLGCRLFGRSWVHWSPPQHLVLFTPRLLRASAERAGLRVVELRTSANGALLSWHVSRALRRGSPPPPRELLSFVWKLTVGSVAFWTLNHALSRLGPWGEEILLVATPGE